MIEIGAWVEIERDASAEARRPPRRAREHTVDPRVRLALSVLLQARHVGQENAAPWDQLVQELVAEGMRPMPTRRLQEAAADLLETEGRPIVGLSEAGVFWARTAEEVERALRQSERRARQTLRRRRMLRRALASLRGQEPLPPPLGGEEVA